MTLEAMREMLKSNVDTMRRQNELLQIQAKEIKDRDIIIAQLQAGKSKKKKP